MLFKKELKTDLLFTKEQCVRDLKMRQKEAAREYEIQIMEMHIKPLYQAQADQTLILTQHLNEHKAAMVKGIERVREEMNA